MGFQLMMNTEHVSEGSCSDGSIPFHEKRRSVQDYELTYIICVCEVCFLSVVGLGEFGFTLHNQPSDTIDQGQIHLA